MNWLWRKNIRRESAKVKNDESPAMILSSTLFASTALTFGATPKL